MPKNKSSKTDRLIVNSSKATGSTTTIVESDLVYRRQNFNIVQSPPRQLSNQIYWLKLSFDAQLSVSASTFFEQNISFSGGLFPGFVEFQSCFDQYCIYSITATFVSATSNNAQQSVRLYTAIDYDSVANIGKSGIFDYSTFEYASLASDGSTSLVRFLKPCIATQVTNTSNLPVPAGISRSWIDCAYSSIQHYGLRIITDTWVNAGTPVEVVYTAIFGFRNSI